MSNWTIFAEDGRTEVFVPLTPDGQDVRVAVGSPIGPRSGVWRFRVEGDGELYIGERSSMGELKVSLHKSGERILAFTKERAEMLRLPSGSARRIYQWSPPDVAPGWVHELSIWVPDSEVTTLVPPKGRQKSIRQIHWLDSPPAGNSMIIRVQTARLLESVPIQFKQHGFMSGTAMLLNRPSGPELCLITASHHVLTDAQREQIEEARSDAKLTCQERERRHARGLRFWSLAEVDATLRLYDLSYLASGPKTLT